MQVLCPPNLTDNEEPTTATSVELRNVSPSNFATPQANQTFQLPAKA